MKLRLRLAEANPISGALRFEVPEADGTSAPRPPRKRGDRIVAKRGRPTNIRHSNKRR